MICSQRDIICLYVVYTSRNIMITIQYVCVFLYACHLSKFTYSKVIGSLNDDSTKCSPNDLNCFENDPIDNSPAEEFSGNLMYIVWSLYYNDENNNINEVDIEIQDYNETLAVGEYLKGPELTISIKNHTKKVKRSLELAEEHPPEGTSRPPVDEGETQTTHTLHTSPAIPSLPSINSVTSIPSISSTLISPSMPSIPQPPTMPTVPSISQPPTIIPSTGPKNTNTPLANDVTTTTPEVEVFETTTEDYGDIGEPNCDYDPFTYVFKCGLSLITSIFGLSDTCCKPLF